MRIFFFIVLLFGALKSEGQAPRKTLWLYGPNMTSTYWTSARLSAKNAGYNFTEVNTWLYGTNVLANSIPEWADYFNAQLVSGQHENVLGIGHDAGGLILRYMAMNQQATNLSGLILDGTPNQGGRIFPRLVSATPGLKSEVIKMVEELMLIRTQAQNCVGCRMLEGTKSWFDEFKHPHIQEYYFQLRPNSPLIQNLQQPNIPYAVIWGNEDEDALTLTRIVGSWHNTGTDGTDKGFLDCYRSELQQRVQEANDNRILALLRRIAGAAGALGKYNATNPFTAGAVVEAEINSIANAIKAQLDIDKELREIFECELIHQALNAKWNLMVAPYEAVTETGIYIPVCVDDPCDHCENTAHDDQEYGYCLAWCYEQLDCDPTPVPYSITYIRYQPHDGLLTRDEQLLAGAAQTYEAKGCNHFQEQFWQYTPIRNAFIDLFNGNAGAAFVVPK